MSHLCVYENKAALGLLVCICGVIEFNTCFNCDHLSRENEPLVNMSAMFERVHVFDLDSRIKVYPSNNHSKFTE